MYGLRNSLFIEQPSSMQKQFVKSSEERHLHLPESEDLKLRDMNPRDKISNNPDHGDADETLLRTASDKRNMLGVSRTSQLKRKRAKVSFLIINVLMKPVSRQFYQMLFPSSK